MKSLSAPMQIWLFFQISTKIRLLSRSISSFKQIPSNRFKKIPTSRRSPWKLLKVLINLKSFKKNLFRWASLLKTLKLRNHLKTKVALNKNGEEDTNTDIITKEAAALQVLKKENGVNLEKWNNSGKLQLPNRLMKELKL